MLNQENKINFLKQEVETERLMLIPISEKYREEIFKEYSEEITVSMNYPPARDISETDAFISKSKSSMEKGNDMVFVIISKEKEEFLGVVAFHATVKEIPEFGIWLKKSAHGNKYGQEAAEGITLWLKIHFKYDGFKYPVSENNIASRKIPEAMGGEIVKSYKKTRHTGKTENVFEYYVKL